MEYDKDFKSKRVINVVDEEGNRHAHLIPKGRTPAVYEGDILKNAFVPIFGLKLEPTSSNKKKYVIRDVLKGSVGDEAGFSENDYLEIRNIRINDEKTAIIAEVYSKNRKKGQMMMILTIL